MSETLPRFHALKVGDQATVSRHFSAGELSQWCALVNFPEARCATVPEPLMAGLFSYLLGEELPGHGTNYLKQSLHFEQDADVGEALTAKVTVTRLRADKALVNLATECTGADGRMICSGEALVLFQC
ncbi:hypothetical protein [Alloalcanivorax xenomutans]|uniref:hypothetical protein n=1 Tax=Alloalcanivorax xenomutans TaxID=1094342 RepID=UPI00231BC9F4|nr:hypothetical protein [Alloalcanivorax xenomutans]